MSLITVLQLEYNKRRMNLDRIKRLRDMAIVRYVFVGGLAYVIELSVLFIFSEVAHLSPTVSVGISFWIGLIVAFLLQKVLAFKNTSRQKKTVAFQVITYLILVVFNYSFTLLFVHFTEQIIGLFASRTIALVFTTLWNFVIYKKLIFREDPLVMPQSLLSKKSLVLLASVAALIISSVYVAYKTSLVHSYNHDQIINGYLSESGETFSQAVFPGTHSQLLKWPFFYLVAQAGNSERVLMISTIIMYLATVLGLLIIVYLLSGKNAKLTALVGSAMSLILALVPPQPLPGKLLPVNAAMITTRNLEYIVFIVLMAMLVLLSKRARPDYRLALGAFLGLVILGASDKLFVVLPVCVAGVALFAALILGRNIRYTLRFLTPLAVSFLAWLSYGILIRIINATGFTTITDESKAPFPFVSNLPEFFTGTKYLIRSVGINFGAVPPAGIERLSLQGLPFLINGLLLLVSTAATVFVLYKWAVTNVKKKHEFWLSLSAWLSVASAGTMALFVATTHEYQSDARYVSLYFFSAVLCLTYMLRYLYAEKKISEGKILTGSIILLAILPFTLLVSRHQFNLHMTATESTIGASINKASAALTEQNVDLLVGDFWFSTATRLKSNNSFEFLPMSTGGCETPNEVLNSEHWEEPEKEVDKSAVYILSDGNPQTKTYNHGCSLSYLNKLYGKYESQIVLRGSASKPIEVIRIYNYDVRTKINN